MMAYELSINRVMTLCKAPHFARGQKYSDRGVLIETFRDQMDAMQRDTLKAAFKEITDAAESIHGKVKRAEKLELLAPEEENDRAEIFVMPPEREGDSDHLVGMFPSKVFRVTMNGLEWLLRARASVTACALERADGMSKLWWSFEGVPANALLEQRPTEAQAVAFMKTTSMMAERGLPTLVEMYSRGLSNVTKGFKKPLAVRPERIHIRLADNNGKPFAALIDAMNLKRASFHDAEQERFGAAAAEGAREVRRFVADIGSLPQKLPEILLDSTVPRMKAVICHYKEATRKKDEVNLVFAGLARSAGMRAGYEAVERAFKAVQYAPPYLRTISAARPISARLAMEHALRLDKDLSPRLAPAIV